MCEAGQREVSRGIRGSGPELRLNSRCRNGLDCGSDVAAGRVAIRGARRGGDGAVAEQSQEDRDATRPDAIHLQVGKAVSTDTRESEGLRQRVCTSSNTCISAYAIQNCVRYNYADTGTHTARGYAVSQCTQSNTHPIAPATHPALLTTLEQGLEGLDLQLQRRGSADRSLGWPAGDHRQHAGDAAGSPGLGHGLGNELQQQLDAGVPALRRQSVLVHLHDD